MGFLAGRRVVVTGGAGFLGAEVCRALEAYQPATIIAPQSYEYDLRRREAVRRLLRVTRPHVIVHVAAVVGGIGANRDNPGRFFFDNAIMGIQLMEEARLFKVSKLVAIGSACAYPKHAPTPFREEDLWNGYPDETSAPYGLAQKMLLVQAQAYRQQYGLNAVMLLPTNLYGPGDNFDPQTSHVIPALLRRVVEAREMRQPWVEAWGSGEASREFLHVRDAARGVAAAAEYYNKPEPVNLGSGHEVKIGRLAELICHHCQFEGEIRWNATQPDGQPRRVLDVSRAEAEFGFKASIPFEDGLRDTIAWYEGQRKQLAHARAA